MSLIKLFALPFASVLFFGLFAVSPGLAEPEPVKIGATLALSGKLAKIGSSQNQALQLASEDINAAGGIGGRPVKLIVEDNAGDPKSAVQGVNKLLQADAIDVLFSSFSHITAAIKDPVKRSNRMMFYAASIGDIATESPFFFRDWGDADSQGKSLAQAAASRGQKRFALLSEASEGCAAIEKSFDGEARRLGLQEAAKESYAPGETDFRPLLLRLKQKNPEVLVFCTWRDSGLVMKQMKTLGLLSLPTVHFLAPLIPDSDTAEVRKLYEENKSLIVWLGFVEGKLTDQQKLFFKRMKERFNSEPRMEAVLAYDDLMVLAGAMKECGSIDAACVSTKVRKSDHTGVSGRLRFDDQGRSNREDLIIEVRNGVWENAK